MCSFSVSTIDCHKPKASSASASTINRWDNHHHLSSTSNILPCWFQNRNRNRLCLPLSFQLHPRSTHDVYIHHMNSTCTLLVPSNNNISRHTAGIRRDIFRFACDIQPFSQQWSIFADLGVSWYYTGSVYEFWWTCRKDWRLTGFRIWKEMFLPYYSCLSQSTFPTHLSVATTNTIFVHVFSPLGSLMWSDIFSQGWCKRYLADPRHSPIK